MNITTKSTPLGNGLYGCRVWVDEVLICEMQVKKIHISWAFYYMFRTLDKCGGSIQTDRSRFRWNEKLNELNNGGYSVPEGMVAPKYKTKIIWHNLSKAVDTMMS